MSSALDLPDYTRVQTILTFYVDSPRTARDVENPMLSPAEISPNADGAAGFIQDEEIREKEFVCEIRIVNLERSH